MLNIKTYKTSEVAKIIGVHPNTVRMYEELELISKPVRKSNGYRIFTDLHIDQFRVARTALQIEVLQKGLRKKALNIAKLTALCKFDDAIKLTREYILTVETEAINASEAARLVQEMLDGTDLTTNYNLKRKDVSNMLDITMDTLRNWEMNGLLKIKRKENGYRVYTDDDIRKIKIIRSLKCANYSLTAILRMLNALEENSGIDVESVLNTPGDDEDIISVCDKLIESLKIAKNNAVLIEVMLYEMKSKYSNPPY